MRRRRNLWTASIFGGAIAIACAVDIDASGAGRACDADGHCASGYHCSAEGRCMRGSPGADPLTGQDPSNDPPGARSEAGGEEPPGDGAADRAPAPSEQDSGDAPQGPDGTGPDAACATPVRYYADEDHDGFGRNDTALVACSPPAGSYATAAGDCNDVNADVHPGQTRYFEAAYETAGGGSFDYDCSGQEDPDPGSPGAAPNCRSAGLLDLNCVGSGFTPSGRTGAGVSSLCGSTELVTCFTAVLACGTNTAASAPKRCR